MSGYANPKAHNHIYKGYRIHNHGYYPPDRSVWWEAINIETGEADFHAHTMRDLKAQIDSANAPAQGREAYPAAGCSAINGGQENG